MFLGIIAKIAIAVAGGTALVGAPFLAKHLMKEEKRIAPPEVEKKALTIDISGKQNCKILVDSVSDGKKIAVCGNNSPLEFLYVTSTFGTEAVSTQKVTTFIGKQEIGTTSSSLLQFTVENTTAGQNSKTETIKVANASKLASLAMLKETNLSTCTWQSKSGIKCLDKDTGSSGEVNVDLEVQPN